MYKRKIIKENYPVLNLMPSLLMTKQNFIASPYTETLENLIIRMQKVSRIFAKCVCPLIPVCQDLAIKHPNFGCVSQTLKHQIFQPVTCTTYKNSIQAKSELVSGFLDAKASIDLGFA